MACRIFNQTDGRRSGCRFGRVPRAPVAKIGARARGRANSLDRLCATVDARNDKINSSGDDRCTPAAGSNLVACLIYTYRRDVDAESLTAVAL